MFQLKRRTADMPRSRKKKKQRTDKNAPADDSTPFLVEINPGLIPSKTFTAVHVPGAGSRILSYNLYVVFLCRWKRTKESFTAASHTRPSFNRKRSLGSHWTLVPTRKSKLPAIKLQCISYSETDFRLAVGRAGHPPAALRRGALRRHRYHHACATRRRDVRQQPTTGRDDAAAARSGAALRTTPQLPLHRPHARRGRCCLPNHSHIHCTLQKITNADYGICVICRGPSRKRIPRRWRRAKHLLKREWRLDSQCR